MTAPILSGTPGAALAGALETSRAAPVQAPRPTADAVAARAAAQQFEAVFIAQMLQPMFAGLSSDGPFGGGRGEEVFRGQLLDQYGRMIADSGGLGISDALTREIMSLQEV